MMKVNLLGPDRTVSWEEHPENQWQDRFQDLKLAPLTEAMAGGDQVILRVCRQCLDSPLQTGEEILYRQQVLQECLQKPELIRRLYAICQEAEERRKNTWYRMNSHRLSTVYSSAADLLKIYMEALVDIRKVMEPVQFTSRGLSGLSRLLQQELSESYLDQLRGLQEGIEEKDGTLISAGFGPYLQGVSYVKRQPLKGLSRLRWLVAPAYTLADRDTKGAKDLELRRDRAINQVANAMAQAAGSLQSFADQLRQELAFYVGAMNLYDRLNGRKLPLCFPEIGEDCRSCQGLYDGSLALTKEEAVVGSSIREEGKKLILITGANQGGKTTFLRALGICQLMAQAGLFVCAEACKVPVRTQVFTHFGREEDRKMDSGKLDEELGRMEKIVARLHPGALLLSNESFSSTNDRDGSEIFLGITRAVTEKGIEMGVVTHLMGYARSLGEREDVLCLLAQRDEAGERTYRMIPGKPQPTAFGEDVYRQVFESP